MIGPLLALGLWALLVAVWAWRWERRAPQVHRDLEANGRKRVGW